MYKKLLTLLFAVSLGINLFANTVTIGEEFNTSTRVIPVSTSSQNSTTSGPVYDSFSQQIYLASELNANEGGAKNISAITFYLKSGNGTTANRTLQVWIMETEETGFSINAAYPYKPEVVYQSVKESSTTKHRVGTKVFEGIVDIGTNTDYTISFNQNGNMFYWDGSKNIIVTVIDKTNSDIPTKAIRHIIGTTSTPRFLHHWETSSVTSGDNYYWVSDADFYYVHLGDTWTSTYTVEGQTNGHKYVSKATFTYSVPLPAPTSPNATDITSTSATLGWTAAAGADSYEVRYGATSGSLGDAINVGNVVSHPISGLEANTTYYFQVRTKIGSNYSAWTDEANFTTEAHIHNAITFDKWTWTNILPTAAGNYYLANDVTLSSGWKPAGSINLCLNGHTVNMGSDYGEIEGVTVAIYDCIGTGSITSSNSSQTILASLSSSYLFVYATIINTGGGRPLVAEDNAFIYRANTLELSDEEDNSGIYSLYDGIRVDAQIMRSFTSSQYNTICLPFDVSSAAMGYIFGSGYDLEELIGAEMVEETLELSFSKKGSLVAGVPYLLKPASDVANPVFETVLFNGVTTPSETSDVNFIGVLQPTNLTINDRNTLFLGAGDELFWPNTSNPIKGYRAYFYINEGSPARKAKSANIVMRGEGAQALDNTVAPNAAQKRIINGQLFIEKNGTLYNAQGQIVK